VSINENSGYEIKISCLWPLLLVRRCSVRGIDGVVEEGGRLKLWFTESRGGEGGGEGSGRGREGRGGRKFREL